MSVSITLPVIIPSYEPEESLTILVQELYNEGIRPVIVVDDGSRGQQYQDIFSDIEEKYDIIVLHHYCNMGKGRALKTAFNYCLWNYPDMVGCVTADSDGQHSVEDICKCAEVLKRNLESLVLGVRDFDAAGVPARSMIGNKCTRIVMKLLTGVKVSDTQTGLRGIPVAFMQKLLNVKGERFEFETNMLVETGQDNISIVEQPVKTIYRKGNSSSHFNMFRDSFSVYAIFGKFIFSSCSSSLIDICLFWLISHLLITAGCPETWHIMIATICARIISAGYNFGINYRVVFKSSRKKQYAVIRYAALAVAIMLASGAAVSGIHLLVGAPEVIIKIIVDSLLFLLSFYVQRKAVY